MRNLCAGLALILFLVCAPVGLWFYAEHLDGQRFYRVELLSGSKVVRSWTARGRVRDDGSAMIPGRRLLFVDAATGDTVAVQGAVIVTPLRTDRPTP